MACLWAVQKFETFLLGRHFKLHTDQHALQQILRSPAKAESILKQSKFIRWAKRLSAYDFEICYRPGEENLVSYALSRLPLAGTNEAVEDYFLVHLIHQLQSHGISMEEVCSCLEADPILPAICRFIDLSWPHKMKVPEKFRPFLHVQQELEDLEELHGILTMP